MEFAHFKVIPSYFQILASGLRLETISGVPVLGWGELPLDRFFNRTLKRGIDLAGAAAGLVLSLPLMAILGRWSVGIARPVLPAGADGQERQDLSRF